MVVVPADGPVEQAGNPALALALALVEEPAPRTRTVLVADDDSDIRRLIGVKLRRAGYAVLEAADGDQALALAGANELDLVLLDVSMPGISGIDVCRQLRQDARLRSIPVIMLTARNEATATTLAYLAGADLFLGKPFSPRAVVDHVTELIANYEQRRATAETTPETPAATADADEAAPKRRLFGLGRRQRRKVGH